MKDAQKERRLNAASLCLVVLTLGTIFGLLGQKEKIAWAQSAPSKVGKHSAMNSSSTRICLISDMNGSYGSVSLPESVQSGVEQLSQMNCELILGAGDLVAGQDSSLSEERLQDMWAEWKRVVASPFLNDGIPVISALGNHDASAERRSSGSFIFQRERDAASQFWSSQLSHPSYSSLRWLSREGFPFNYSLTFNSIGIIVFDGSSASEISRNRSWVENQLKALSSDDSIKTRLVVGHLPLFAVAKGRERVGEILYESQEFFQLFNDYKVDFYISGHHHAFFPGRPAIQNSDYGTVQLALGALGDGPRRLLSNNALPAENTVTLLDVLNSQNSAQRFSPERFDIQARSPWNGEILPLNQLPEWLDSFDGRGRPIELRRFDL